MRHVNFSNGSLRLNIPYAAIFFVLIRSVKTNILPHLKEWGSFVLLGSVLRSDGQRLTFKATCRELEFPSAVGLFRDVSADAFLYEGEGVAALF